MSSRGNEFSFTENRKKCRKINFVSSTNAEMKSVSLQIIFCLAATTADDVESKKM